MLVAAILFISYWVKFGTTDMEPFIVHGGYAKIANFPYSAFLYIKCVGSPDDDEPSPFICGSSILNQDILLTAGHCLHGCIQDSSITVSVGHEKIMKGPVALGHSFLIHEQYDDSTVTNDIAIVRLKKRLRFNLNVSRLALMRKPPYNEKAFVAGWGQDGKNAFSTKLKYTEQYVWKESKCMKLLKQMPRGTICAYSKLGYADRGDSGSPLVVRGYIQIGLVSFKRPYLSESVIIYTDVGYFYDWISKSAVKLMCKV